MMMLVVDDDPPQKDHVEVKVRALWTITFRILLSVDTRSTLKE